MDRPSRLGTIGRRRLVLALGLAPLALLSGCGEVGSVKLGPNSRPVGSPPPRAGAAKARPGKAGKPKSIQPG